MRRRRNRQPIRAGLLESVRKRVWDALTPRPLREALSSLQGQLLMDEVGWVNLGGSGGVGVEENPILRRDAVIASRYYWQRDSLYGNLIRLVKNYTFGRGIRVRANDTAIQKLIDRFWADEDNQLLATPTGQWELSETIQTDGELPLVFFVDRFLGNVKVGIIDTLEITNVITHSENNRKPLYYQRTWSKEKWSWAGQSQQVEGRKIDYYPDVSAATNPAARSMVECPTCALEQYNDIIQESTYNEPVVEREKQLREGLFCEVCGCSLREAHVEIGSDPEGDMYATVGNSITSVYAHIWKVNTRSKRGLPPAYASLTWVKTHKGFMEDRATLTLAAATFAFTQRIKGGALQLARMVTQWGQGILGRYGGRRGRERREGAQTLIENEATEMSQFQFDTRSGQAYQDSRMFRQLVGSGGGIIEQDLTGDPTIGNLASMRAMAATQQKNFESWQEFFKGLYLKVFDFVIAMAIKFGELTLKKKDGSLRDLTIEIDFPPITTSDLTQIIGAISQLITAQSQARETYVPPQRIASYILQAFGETDIQQVLKELGFDRREKQEPLPDKTAEALAEALQLLMEAKAS